MNVIGNPIDERGPIKGREFLRSLLGGGSVALIPWFNYFD